MNCSVFRNGTKREVNRVRRGCWRFQVRGLKRAPADAGRLPSLLIQESRQSMTGEEAWRALAKVLAVGGRGTALANDWMKVARLVGRRSSGVNSTSPPTRNGCDSKSTQTKQHAAAYPAKTRPRLGASWHFSGRLIVSVSLLPLQPIESCAVARLLSLGENRVAQHSASRTTFAASPGRVS